MAHNTISDTVGITRWFFNGIDLDKVIYNDVVVFSKILHITIEAKPNDGKYINLKKLIDTHRHHGETEIVFDIPPKRWVQAIKTGGMLANGVLKCTLNVGVGGGIAAIQESGSALYVTETLYLHNVGSIYGGGGRGGVGGKGGKGHAGADTTKTTKHTKSMHDTRKANGHHDAYWEGHENAAGVNPCDYVYWSGHLGKHCSGKTGTISRYDGTFTRGKLRSTQPNAGFNWNVYDIVHNYIKKWSTTSTIKGGAGGTGGNGGNGGVGYYWGHSKNPYPGHTGHTGGAGHKVSGGHTGSRGGKGGTGGDGGGWGKAGGTGHTGSRGGGHGSSGVKGAGGGRAGYSIYGYSKVHFIAKGTLAGPTSH